eukprot:GGOE01015340.1.p1 GENE.GGOE01015340.1~~GGOE01015340.1.p1  ORF type:complete len:713 (+),score=128.86 GGOE01015340.1:147-2285(+)
MAGLTNEAQLEDLQRQLLVLDIDRYQDRDPRRLRETLAQRKVESWEFLQSRRIRVSSITDLDGPVDILRATLGRFSFTSVALVLRLRILLHAVKVLQRFFRLSKYRMARRIGRIIEHWCSKEVAVRDTLRLSIQQFQKANAFQHAAVAHPALWHDYLQCRVPRALKEKTVCTVLQERRHQWRQEWQTHRQMQAKAHLLLEQERLILASNHFRTSPEIEQLREHRRMIQRIPEPVFVADVASFSVAELLVLALEIQEADLADQRHNYYLPGTSGEPFPTVEVMAMDNAWEAAETPTLKARPSHQILNAAADVDWHRPQYGPGAPFALNPKQQQEAWPDHALTTGDTADSISPPNVARPRATQYCYAVGRPRVRRLTSTAAAPGDMLSMGCCSAYDVQKTLREELRQTCRKEAAGSAKSKAQPTRRRRWPKGAVWGRVDFDDAVQTFGADVVAPHTKQCIARPTPHAARSREDEPDWELELVLSKLAARKKGKWPSQPPARFRPLQHPGEAPAVALTPRTSCSPSSPRYRPPGVSGDPLGHAAAVMHHTASSFDMEMGAQSLESSQGVPMGIVEAAQQETIRWARRYPPTLTGSEESTAVDLGEVRAPEGERQPLKARRLRKPTSGTGPTGERASLALWSSCNPKAGAPTGCSVMAGIAAQTGLLAALKPPPPFQSRAAIAAVKASPAAALLAHVASRQSELLKQLANDLPLSQ